MDYSADGGAVCVALSNQFQYAMVNILNSKVQELFHYEPESTKGVIIRVGPEEFLLNGPTDLMGMFVTSEGTSQRAPLSWSNSIEALGYSFPYVISLGNNVLTAHSIVSQDSKTQRQVITFKGGRMLLNYENKVFVCSQKELYCLVPIPYKKQIEALLADKKVNEALQLAHIAMETAIGEDRDEKLLSEVQQQAGFVYFSEGVFADAADLMLEGGLDPREIITLFPSLLTSSWTFLPSKDIHSIKDISGLMKGSKTFMAEAKNFLLSFLEESRQRSCYQLCKEIITLFPSLLTSSWTFLPSKDIHSIKDISGLMKGSKTFMAEAMNFLLSFLVSNNLLTVLVESIKLYIVLPMAHIQGITKEKGSD
ncbi:Transforming growth factor-beta receptor-associated protein 1 [Exaiptasia diaphana]|nr:Transforming growth factor-beta receptor-associated protein 1 [Exaiptasia diaphana]